MRDLSRRYASQARRLLPYLLIVAAIAVVYRGWLAHGVISYADWNYASDARLRDFLPIPTIWNALGGTGGADITSGPLLPLVFVQAVLYDLGLTHDVTTRLVWIFLGLIAGPFAAYKLAVSLYSNRLAGVVSALFVAFNFYIMRILSGGQLTVGSGCLLIPVILWLFYRAVNQPSASRISLTGLILGVQIMYDLRSTYLTLGVLLLFSLYYVLAQSSAAEMRRAFLRIILQFVAIALIALLMHLYWLLPGRYAEKIALPKGYTSVGWVATLSYFLFGNAFTIYRPLLGQEPFILPYLFLLPILAFAAFLRRRPTYVDLFLISLALITIFFVKGGNDPGGAIYNWLFTHLPGFNMYRDPSKFYQPLALAYALLLGRTVTLLSPRASKGTDARPSRLRKAGRWAVPLLCFIPVFAAVWPIATGSPYGTLVPVNVPSEYIALQHFIDAQPHFFRVLWVFGQTEYIGDSDQHPAFGADTVGQQIQSYRSPIPLPNSFAAKTWLLSHRAQEVLRALSVKYVAVGDNLNPGDLPSVTAENRAAEARYLALVRRAFPHDAETRIGNIHLFRNPSYLPQMFITGTPISVAQAHHLLQRAAAPQGSGIHQTGKLGEYPVACNGCFSDVSTPHARTRYEIMVHHETHPFLLVLNQSFDPNWDAYIEPSNAPQPFWWTWRHPAVLHQNHFTVNGFANAWWIDKPGSYRIVVEYWPQRLTDVGFILCWLTIAMCVMMSVVPFVLAWVRRRANRPRVAESGVPEDGMVTPERAAGRQSAR